MNQNATLDLPITIRIEKMIPGGKGLAFHQGKAIFISQVVPDDLVQVTKIKDRGSYLEVLAYDVVQPSINRVAPPCPYFGECGGCDFQQMAYSSQLHSKKEIMLEALKRIGKLNLPLDRISIFPSSPLNYRNRIQIKLSNHRDSPGWGFYAAGSHRVCEIDNCLIVTESLWQAVEWIKDYLHKMPDALGAIDEVEVLEGDNQEFLANLTLKQGKGFLETIRGKLKIFIETTPFPLKWTISLCDSSGVYDCIWGKGHVWKTVGKFTYRVSHGTFFQVNETMLEELQSRVVRRFSGVRALDLFCGVGYFTLPLSQRFEFVEAVEGNLAASSDLKASLEKNRVTNCRVVNHDLSTYLDWWRATSRFDLDLMVMDPPRTGLPPRTVEGVSRIKVKELVYVSCDPSTLARDLRILANAGYEIASVELLDLFPQTHHFEGIVHLVRSSEKG